MRPHFKFWPKRLPHAITLPATSLWDNLETSARRYPDKAALVFFGTVLTYAQLLQKAEQLSQCLRRLGVQKGDRIVLCMHWFAGDRPLGFDDSGHAPRVVDGVIVLRGCMGAR